MIFFRAIIASLFVMTVMAAESESSRGIKRSAFGSLDDVEGQQKRQKTELARELQGRIFEILEGFLSEEADYIHKLLAELSDKTDISSVVDENGNSLLHVALMHGCPLEVVIGLVSAVKGNLATLNVHAISLLHLLPDWIRQVWSLKNTCDMWKGVVEPICFACRLHIDHPDENGYTPLHLAFQKNLFHFAELLITYGARGEYDRNPDRMFAIQLVTPEKRETFRRMMAKYELDQKRSAVIQDENLDEDQKALNLSVLDGSDIDKNIKPAEMIFKLMVLSRLGLLKEHVRVIAEYTREPESEAGRRERGGASSVRRFLHFPL